MQKLTLPEAEISIISRKNSKMRSLTLASLLINAALAVRLHAFQEATQLPSKTDGPQGGFPTESCSGNAPKSYKDPVCF